MGNGSGTEIEAPGRTCALRLILWRNRTKVAGYAGVIAGAVQMAVLAGQHWQLALLGATVAAIGHYNDHANDP